MANEHEANDANEHDLLSEQLSEVAPDADDCSVAPTLLPPKTLPPGDASAAAAVMIDDPATILGPFLGGLVRMSSLDRNAHPMMALAFIMATVCAAIGPGPRLFVHKLLSWAAQARGWKIVVGPPGTSKTHVMRHIEEAFRAALEFVNSLPPTGSAGALDPITHASTVPALVQGFVDVPGGSVLQFEDEISAVVARWGAINKGNTLGDTATILTLRDGGAVHNDTKTFGKQTAGKNHFTMTGCIQPKIWHKLFLVPSAVHSGLEARFTPFFLEQAAGSPAEMIARIEQHAAQSPAQTRLRTDLRDAIRPHLLQATSAATSLHIPDDPMPDLSEEMQSNPMAQAFAQQMTARTAILQAAAAADAAAADDSGDDGNGGGGSGGSAGRPAKVARTQPPGDQLDLTVTFGFLLTSARFHGAAGWEALDLRLCLSQQADERVPYALSAFDLFDMLCRCITAACAELRSRSLAGAAANLNKMAGHVLETALKLHFIEHVQRVASQDGDPSAPMPMEVDALSVLRASDLHRLSMLQRFLAAGNRAAVAACAPHLFPHISFVSGSPGELRGQMAAAGGDGAPEMPSYRPWQEIIKAIFMPPAVRGTEFTGFMKSAINSAKAANAKDWIDAISAVKVLPPGVTAATSFVTAMTEHPAATDKTSFPTAHASVTLPTTVLGRKNLEAAKLKPLRAALKTLAVKMNRDIFAMAMRVASGQAPAVLAELKTLISAEPANTREQLSIDVGISELESASQLLPTIGEFVDIGGIIYMKKLPPIEFGESLADLTMSLEAATAREGITLAYSVPYEMYSSANADAFHEAKIRYDDLHKKIKTRSREVIQKTAGVGGTTPFQQL